MSGPLTPEQREEIKKASETMAAASNPPLQATVIEAAFVRFAEALLPRKDAT